MGDNLLEILTDSISWYKLIHTLGVDAVGLIKELAFLYSRTICTQARNLCHALRSCGVIVIQISPTTCCRSPSAARLLTLPGIPNRLLNRLMLGR